MTSFWRAVIFILTVIVIFGGTILAIFYARGFRVDLGNKSIGSTGLLVATSVPDGAQVWVNGILRTATNATVALTPGEINVEIKKSKNENGSLSFSFFGLTFPITSGPIRRTH